MYQFNIYLTCRIIFSVLYSYPKALFLLFKRQQIMSVFFSPKLLWIFSYVYIHIYSVQVVDLLSFTDLWFYVTTAEHDKNTASKTYFVFKKKYWCTSPINEQIFLFGSWMVEGSDLLDLPWLQWSSDAQSRQ